MSKDKGIGSFYLGRVTKMGTLNHDTLIKALKETEGLITRKHKWNGNPSVSSKKIIS